MCQLFTFRIKISQANILVEENLHFAIVLEFKKAHSKVMRSVTSVNIKTDFK